MRLMIMTVLFSAFTCCQIQAQCPPAKTAGNHIVQKGETLYRISKKYNVTVDQLCEWNNIRKEDGLPVCRELRVKAPAASNGSQPVTDNNGIAQGKSEHIVRPGETVEAIARAYGYTVERFRQFNQIQPGETLHPGRILSTNDCVCPPLTTSPAPSESTAVAQYYQPDSYANEDERLITSAATNTTNTGTTSPANTTTQTNSTGFVSPEETLINQKQTASQTATTKPATNRTVTPPKAVAPFMSAEEVAMVDEINLVRFDPRAYVRIAEAYLEDSRNGRAFGSVEACQELINELKGMNPLPTLEPSECLYAVAKKHAEDQRPTGSIDHLGRDGSYPWDRVRRECKDMSDGNENIVGGPADVRNSVLLLLVDDGIPSRGHRRTLLNKDWQYVACYKAGMVGTMPNSWVQQFGR